MQRGKEYLRWLPWVCCFTGCRLDEIAGAAVKDIEQVGPYWVLNVRLDHRAAKESRPVIDLAPAPVAVTPIRILVADDQALFRIALVELLARDPRIEVMGHVGDGLQAVQKAVMGGKLQGNESFPVKCTLEIPSLGVRVPFDGEIKLK